MLNEMMKSGFCLVTLALFTAFLHQQPVDAQELVSKDPPLISIQASDLDSLIQLHKGDVVVLNFWASWCKPCKEEFPDLLKLRTEYKERGLDLVLISMDVEEVLEKGVIRFLKSMKVSFESYIKFPGKDGDFIDAVDSEWTGAIPFTVVFDRNGVKRKTLLGKQSFEVFQETVVPLL